MLLLLSGALVAGVLTTLAPCVLPLLPVIVGGSATGHRLRPYVMTASLAISVAAFTLALKAFSQLLLIPTAVWAAISGGLLIVLGLVGMFPALWDRGSGAISDAAGQGMRAARRRDGLAGDVLAGAALGPVFSACSPLYGYVVVTVLPAEPLFGVALLGTYLVGLCGTLLAIALVGRRLIARLGWAADSQGWLRRSLGLVFVMVGIAVVLGWDRSFQAWLLEWADWDLWTADRWFLPR